MDSRQVAGRNGLASNLRKMRARQVWGKWRRVKRGKNGPASSRRARGEMIRRQVKAAPERKTPAEAGGARAGVQGFEPPWRPKVSMRNPAARAWGQRAAGRLCARRPWGIRPGLLRAKRGARAFPVPWDLSRVKHRVTEPIVGAPADNRAGNRRRPCGEWRNVKPGQALRSQRDFFSRRPVTFRTKYDRAEALS